MGRSLHGRGEDQGEWMTLGGRGVHGRWGCKAVRGVVWPRRAQGYPGSPAITVRPFAVSEENCALSSRQRSRASGAISLLGFLRCGLFMESYLKVAHGLSRRKIPVMDLSEANWLLWGDIHFFSLWPLEHMWEFWNIGWTLLCPERQ